MISIQDKYSTGTVKCNKLNSVEYILMVRQANGDIAFRVQVAARKGNVRGLRRPQ